MLWLINFQFVNKFYKDYKDFLKCIEKFHTSSEIYYTLTYMKPKMRQKNYICTQIVHYIHNPYHVTVHDGAVQVTRRELL